MSLFLMIQQYENELARIRGQIRSMEPVSYTHLDVYKRQSPDCATFSIAAISHHRKKNPETGSLEPVSAYAKFCDRVDKHVLELIEQLQPKYYFIENPRGGMRKMEWMKNLPRYTVTYCQYGDNRMKPPDIWTNHPNPEFLPMCHNGDSCHVPAPRGSKTGTQGLKGSRERSVIPQKLCEHIVDICEEG